MSRLMQRLARTPLPALLAGAVTLASLTASHAAAPAKKIDTFDGIFAPNIAIDAKTASGKFHFSALRVPAISTNGGEGFTFSDVLVDAPVMDGVALNAGYRVDSMAGLFNTADANAGDASDALFAGSTAVNSPYVSLTNGGSFLGTTLELANDLHFSVAQSTLTPMRDSFWSGPSAMAAQLMAPSSDRHEAQSTIASLNWKPSAWAGFGMTASQTTEQNSLLGRASDQALGLVDSAKTTAVGISGRVGLGSGWVTTASYSEGITQLDLKPTALIATTPSDLHSRAYGVSVAKQGLFGRNDTLGLAVSRPAQVYSGNVSLLTATPLDSRSNAFTYTRDSMALGTRTPETDVELGYVTTFFDGALALQTNAAYQMNFSGQNGKNALAVVSRAKINF